MFYLLDLLQKIDRLTNIVRGVRAKKVYNQIFNLP